MLVISRSQRQAYNFFKRVMDHYREFPLVPHVSQNMSELNLVNGARLLSLPNNEATIRGEAAVDLLVIDEASRVPDNLWGAVRPMLAVSGGRTVALSTPFGKRGWYYQEWQEGRLWRKKEVHWSKCPRIKMDFVEDERHKHGDSWVRQEFECEFLDEVGSMFNVDAIEALMSYDEEPVY